MDTLDRLDTLKVYSGSVCDLVGQAGHCEGILWECVWIGGTGITL